jgi:hypothetical protein
VDFFYSEKFFVAWAINLGMRFVKDLQRGGKEALT